ncbi:MAG TPA: 50S ribosomal protein L18 [Candidatus Dormibacteraeota bacterium]|nr:50S ribosomal protein L18 [Candidatus Dormibacteraeota bacterium]
MILKESKNERRYKRHRRLRKKVNGTQARPRLVVFRSLHHTYAQVIDDSTGRTLAAASTREKAIAEGLESLANSSAAEKIGAAVGERAKSAGISAVVFDAGGYKYHGRVKALADAARGAGLEF